MNSNVCTRGHTVRTSEQTFSCTCTFWQTILLSKRIFRSNSFLFWLPVTFARIYQVRSVSSKFSNVTSSWGGDERKIQRSQLEINCLFKLACFTGIISTNYKCHQQQSELNTGLLSLSVGRVGKKHIFCSSISLKLAFRFRLRKVGEQRCTRASVRFALLCTSVTGGVSSVFPVWK